MPGGVRAAEAKIIWFNWLIGAPVKRSLTAYDHVLPAHTARSR